MRSRLARSLGLVAVLPLFGLIFWMAATVASSLPGLAALAVNVHGLGLVNYAGDSSQRLAPLSHQLLEDAAGDANGSLARATPTATAAPAPTTTPRPPSTPTPRPVTTPKPTPTPTPVPVPTPTPTPVLPLPLPLPVPILPSLLPGLLR